MKRFLALSLVLTAPRFAGAASDPAAEVRARIAAAKLPQADADALLAPLQHADAAQLPEAPVAAKLLEGLAKNVAPARIAAAAEQVVTRLSDAQAALTAAQASASDRGAALGELALVEARLGSREPLLQLAGKAQGASAPGLIAAATALAELRDAGVPVDRAAEVLGGLAARGYAPEQISAVPKLFAQYRAEGGRDVGGFLSEIASRGASKAELRDVVDPFGAHGQVINHRASDGTPGRPESRGQGGRVLVEDADRGGSNPAADDDLAARTGRGVGQPPNGATSGAPGKGKGKGNPPPGQHGNDPGE